MFLFVLSEKDSRPSLMSLYLGLDLDRLCPRLCSSGLPIKECIYFSLDSVPNEQLTLDRVFRDKENSSEPDAQL